MADQSISQLGTATALTGDELTVVVQNGVTKQTQLQDIADLGGPAGPPGPQGPGISLRHHRGCLLDGGRFDHGAAGNFAAP